MSLLTLFEGDSFHPRRLFIGSTVGAIYDYDDYAYLYQKSDGSTPVTALEQPVGLMRDKRYGNEVGADARSAGAPALLGSATAATFNTSTGEGSVTRVDDTNQSSVRFTLTANTFYRINLVNNGSADLQLRSGTESGTVWSTVAAGATVTHLVLASTAGHISITAASAATIAFTVSALVSLPGIHAYQSTDAARPVLSARYNLLTATEDITNASWVKFGPTPPTINANVFTAPNGSQTMDEVVQGGSASAAGIHQSITAIAVAYSVVVVVRAGTASTLDIGLRNTTDSVWLDVTAVIESGPGSISGSGATIRSVSGLTSSYTRIRLTMTSPLAAGKTLGFYVYPQSSGANTAGMSVGVWGADLRLTADANARLPAYQRVTTASDYDSAGFPRFLRIDATDDQLVTAACDLTGTGKLTVFAGVTKASDAANGVIVEHGLPGTDALAASVSAARSADNSFAGDIRGGGNEATVRANGFAAPYTGVLTVSMDYAGATIADQVGVRVNGATIAGTSLGVKATGSAFGNSQFFIGARSGGTLRLNNGRLYPMVIIGKQCTAGEIAAVEAWVNSRTRAF